MAVPRVYEELIPLNGTTFVVEWESFLDPIRALRDSFEPVLHEGCHLGDWFVRPTRYTVDLLRIAALDDGITERFRASRGSLFFEGHYEERLTDIASGENERLPLEERAISILLGVAILAATRWPIGLAGLWLRRRFDDYYSDEAMEARRQKWAGSDR